MTAKISKESLAARFRAARRIAGFTQPELEKRTGVAQAVISRIERGETASSVETLQKLAAALKTTVSYLIGDDAGEDFKGVLAPGLSQLVKDTSLMKAMHITQDEIDMVRHCKLPGHVTKDGYVQLIITVRTITAGTMGYTRS